MHIFNATDVENYMKQDWIMQLLKSCAEKSCVEKNVITVATNEWLMTDVNKRMIYAEMYGDFLIEKQNKKVLDAGGGITLDKCASRKHRIYACGSACSWG